MIPGIDKYFRPGFIIQRQSSGTDAWDSPKAEWADLATIRATIRMMNGDEVYTSRKTQEKSDHRMYCRKTDIQRTDRVSYMGVLYEVVAVNDVMNFEELLQVELIRR